MIAKRIGRFDWNLNKDKERKRKQQQKIIFQRERMLWNFRIEFFKDLHKILVHTYIYFLRSRHSAEAFSLMNGYY